MERIIKKITVLLVIMPLIITPLTPIKINAESTYNQTPDYTTSHESANDITQPSLNGNDTGLHNDLTGYENININESEPTNIPPTSVTETPPFEPSPQPTESVTLTGQPSTIQDIYIEDFINNIINPLVLTARSGVQFLSASGIQTLSANSIEMQNIRNRARENPYVTQITTRIDWGTTYLHLRIVGNYFVSSDSPITLNQYLFDRSYISPFINVQDTNEMARIEYDRGWTWPGPAPYNIAVIPSDNRTGQMRGRIYNVTNYRINFGFDYYPEIQRIHIDSFIDLFIRRNHSDDDFYWPFEDDIQWFRNWIINSRYKFVKYYRFTGVIMARPDRPEIRDYFEISMFFFESYNNLTPGYTSTHFFNVPSILRGINSPLIQYYPINDPRFPGMTNVRSILWNQRMYSLWGYSGSGGTGGQNGIPRGMVIGGSDLLITGSLTTLEKFHIFAEDENGYDNGYDNGNGNNNGNNCPPSCCQCPYPPTVTENHFHEHFITENHFHETIINEHHHHNYHETVENHFHEHFITENHFHEHFITETHYHEHFNEYFITEEHEHHHQEIHNHFHDDGFGERNYEMLHTVNESIEHIRYEIETINTEIINTIETQTETLLETITYMKTEITETVKEAITDLTERLDYWYEGFGIMVFFLIALSVLAFVIWITIMIWRAIWYHMVQVWA